MLVITTPIFPNFAVFYWKVDKSHICQSFLSLKFDRFESCDKELISVQLGLFSETFMEIDECVLCETGARFEQHICEKDSKRNSRSSLKNFYFI